MGMDQWSPEKQAEMKKTMGLSYFGQLIASLVMFYVLARFTGGMGKLTVSGGLMVAFWTWLGFVVPLSLGSVLWGGKKILFWLQTGSMLITLLAAGAIIGAFK
jgi:hypothetical protein